MADCHTNFSGCTVRSQQIMGRAFDPFMAELHSRAVAAFAAKADQRKMPKRRHRAMFNQPHPTMPLRPLRKASETEFRPPAKPPCQRGEALLEGATRAFFRADMVHEDDLAAGPQHAGEFIERAFR